MDPQLRLTEIAAASLLLLGFAIFAVGASMFWIRGGIRGGAPPSHTYYAWERGLILAAVVFTALGFVLLEARLEDTAGMVLGRAGTAAYFFGAVLLVAAEASGLARGFQEGNLDEGPLVVVYVVLAFLAQAAIGGSFLQAHLLAPWIGWLAVLWNLGWLATTLFVRSAMYIPFFHHLVPLVIGIALLTRPA